MACANNDPDPEGDLMLLIGSNNESIRVSSKVLSLASPVFAAMLGPKFAEGQSLLTKSSRGGSAPPAELRLPDDDPEAMGLFCKIIHFNKHATPDISFSLLEKLAFLSDKYDAFLALSSASEVWLSNFKGSKEGESSFAKVLWISYAMGNHRAFSRVSREMVRQCTKDELNSQSQEIEGTSLPMTVLESLEETHGEELLSLCHEIEAVLTPHLARPCPGSKYHQTQQEMCSHVSQSGHYIQELYRLDIWPIVNKDRPKSIEKITTQLYLFENNDVYIDRHRCNVYKIDCKKLLRIIAGKSRERNLGLCLNCVKNGKVMTADGNCRATSLELCKDLSN